MVCSLALMMTSRFITLDVLREYVRQLEDQADEAA